MSKENRYRCFMCKETFTLDEIIKDNVLQGKFLAHLFTTHGIDPATFLSFFYE